MSCVISSSCEEQRWLHRSGGFIDSSLDRRYWLVKAKAHDDHVDFPLVCCTVDSLAELADCSIESFSFGNIDLSNAIVDLRGFLGGH